MSAYFDSRIHRVRQLLQRLAAPHPGLRSLTADLEARVAALSPRLPVLEAAPFDGLAAPATTDAPRGKAAPVRRRHSNPSASGERLAPAATRSPAPGAAGSTCGARTVEFLSSSPAPKMQRASSLDSAVHARPAHDPAVTPLPGRTEPSKAPLHEFVVAPGKRRSSPEVSPVEPTRADHAVVPEDTKVDVGVLAQRVMQKRTTRSPTAPALRSNSADRTDSTRVDPVQPDPKGAQQGTRGIVLPLSPHRSESPLLLTSESNRAARRRAGAVSLVATRTAGSKPESAPEPGDKQHSSRVPQEASRVSPNTVHESPFLFDAFEERGAGESNDFALTQRIDQILRDQARRQGVDLT